MNHITTPAQDAAQIEKLGGPSAVAHLLGLPTPGGVQRVSNWKKRGIPAGVKLEHAAVFLGTTRDVSDPELTINNVELSSWIDDFRKSQASINYMDKLCAKAWGKSAFDHLNWARAQTKCWHAEIVGAITRRGGLLLIGGAA
jgi:hypothetical protein